MWFVAVSSFSLLGSFLLFIWCCLESCWFWFCLLGPIWLVPTSWFCLVGSHWLFCLICSDWLVLTDWFCLVVLPGRFCLVGIVWLVHCLCFGLFFADFFCRCFCQVQFACSFLVFLCSIYFGFCLFVCWGSGWLSSCLLWFILHDVFCTLSFYS